LSIFYYAEDFQMMDGFSIFFSKLLLEIRNFFLL